MKDAQNADFFTAALIFLTVSLPRGTYRQIKPDYATLYREIYSHDLNDVEKVWDERIIVYKFDIRYKFFLSEYVDGDDYHKPTENCYIFKNELVDILKEMYPDEKIYYF